MDSCIAPESPRFEEDLVETREIRVMSESQLRVKLLVAAGIVGASLLGASFVGCAFDVAVAGEYSVRLVQRVADV